MEINSLILSVIGLLLVCVVAYKKLPITFCFWIFALHTPFSELYLYFGIKFITFFLSIIYIVINFKYFKLNLKFYKGLVFYILICFISISYSSSPLNTFLKVFEYLIMFSYFITVGSKYSFKKVEYLIIILLLIPVVSSFTTLIFDSSLFLETGVLFAKFPAITPNTLTQYAVIGFIFFHYKYKQSRLKRFIIFMSCCLLISIFAGSRTSLAILFIYMCFIFFKTKNNNSIIKKAFLFIIFNIVLIISFEFLKTVLFRNQDIELFLSLSGRVGIWTSVFDLIQLKPWLGYGYDSSFLFNENLYLEGTIPSNSDSTYLDILYFTGLLGLIPFIFQLKVFYNNFKNQDVFIWIFLVMLARSLTGSTFHVANYSLVFVILLFSYKLSKPNGLHE
jgi:O-antigen ligase